MPPARSRNTAPSAMSIRRWPRPSSTTSWAADGRTLHEGPSARAAGNKRACLAEPVRARKAVGAEPAGGAAPRYARVSTDDQNLALQLDALRAAGCEVIHEDKSSGVLSGRKGLAEALKRCAAGDVLVVWKLDRLARSLHDLAVIAANLKGRGVGLKILTGEGAAVDTTHPQGRMIFGILAVMAEFERELMSERTVAGMAAAKRRGRHVGRPRE